MRYVLALILSTFVTQTTLAAPAKETSEKTFTFNFKNADLQQVIDAYVKISNETLVIDPAVRGKISILSPQKVTIEEAFNLLSEALAINGYAFITQDKVLRLQTARNVQRSLIPVSNQLPEVRPEQMFSWVYSTKNLSADEINMSLRILASKDGEIIPFGKDKIIFTDWTSNLHRIQKTLALIDVKK